MKPEFDYMPRSPTKCAKCGGLFLAAEGVADEIECFRCAPRPVSSPLPLASPASARRSRRHHTDHRDHFRIGRDDGLENMLHGGLVIILGGLIAAALHAFVPELGGIFILVGGVLLFGALKFIFGLTQYFS